MSPNATRSFPKTIHKSSNALIQFLQAYAQAASSQSPTVHVRFMLGLAKVGQNTYYKKLQTSTTFTDNSNCMNYCFSFHLRHNMLKPVIGGLSCKNYYSIDIYNCLCMVLQVVTQIPKLRATLALILECYGGPMHNAACHEIPYAFELK